MIMSALAVYKSDLSNMLAVGTKIPAELIDRIGPAHGVGRRNWMALAETLADDSRLAKKALQIANESAFTALSSKERFEAVAGGLKQGALNRSPDVAVSHDGREIGRISSSKQKVTLTVDRKTSPEFAEFVLQQLPQLYGEYRKRQG